MTVSRRHCTSCGAEVSQEASFCIECGKPLKFRTDVVEAVKNAPICPYCNAALKSFPKGKKMCPECKKPILVRSTPFDETKRLVTEAKAEEIDAEKAILRELKELDAPALQKFESSKLALKESTRGVSQKRLLQALRNAKWQMYNRELLDYGKNDQWGLYRNVRFEMGEQLRTEGRLAEALRTYFEVYYRDFNGEPSFKGGWNTQLSFVAPGVVQRIQSLITKLALTREDSKAIFCENQLFQDSLKMPIAVSVAWKDFEKRVDF